MITEFVHDVDRTQFDRSNPKSCVNCEDLLFTRVHSGELMGVCYKNLYALIGGKEVVERANPPLCPKIKRDPGTIRR